MCGSPAASTSYISLLIVNSPYVEAYIQHLSSLHPAKVVSPWPQQAPASFVSFGLRPACAVHHGMTLRACCCCWMPCRACLQQMSGCWQQCGCLRGRYRAQVSNLLPAHSSTGSDISLGRDCTVVGYVGVYPRVLTLSLRHPGFLWQPGTLATPAMLTISVASLAESLLSQRQQQSTLATGRASNSRC